MDEFTIDYAAALTEAILTADFNAAMEDDLEDVLDSDDDLPWNEDWDD